MYGEKQQENNNKLQPSSIGKTSGSKTDRKFFPTSQVDSSHGSCNSWARVYSSSDSTRRRARYFGFPQFAFAKFALGFGGCCHVIMIFRDDTFSDGE